jgi:hypothetical protein
MLRELLTYFRQLDATSDELAQLFLGLELTGSSADAPLVRNENDLLAGWHDQNPGLLSADTLSRCLESPDWLMSDHVTAANLARAGGSTAAARVWLAGQLDPVRAQRERERGPGRGNRAGQAGEKGDRRTAPSSVGPRSTTSGPALSGEQLLDAVSSGPTGADSVVEALRAYCRSGAVLDLTRPLRGRGRDAKTLRRLLRPRPDHRVRCEAPLSSWDDPPAARAIRSAAEAGWALLHWDLPDVDRSRVRAGLRALGRAPGDVRHVLLTDTSYTGKAGERRGTVEILLVAPARENDRKTTEEAVS